MVCGYVGPALSIYKKNPGIKKDKTPLTKQNNPIGDIIKATHFRFSFLPTNNV